ncbi:MAG: hypothetical protein HYX60_07860 [Legionella longbeachae]|nr:hypothetical protein [Legionella longbeachae]
MLTTEIKKTLNELLTKATLPIKSSFQAPHDYHSLKLQILEQELEDEINILTTFLLNNPNTFADEFKIRAKERSKRNSGTSLSFMAFLEGACNQLYWDIAILLFKPATLADMLHVLMPEVHKQLVLNFELNLSKNPSKEQQVKALLNPIILLQKKSLDMLECPSDLNELAHFVLYQDIIFDTRNIARFPFKIHQLFFKILKSEYPFFAEKLYQHNDRFKKLHTHLLLVSNQGQTPAEAIEFFIQEALLGSETLTGDRYASIKVEVAYTELVEYVEL